MTDEEVRLTRAATVWSGRGEGGKTTITTNLAEALERKGNRVLVIDLDPQVCGLTDQIGFGDDVMRSAERDITRVLVTDSDETNQTEFTTPGKKSRHDSSSDQPYRDLQLDDLIISTDDLSFDLIPAHNSLTDFSAIVSTQYDGNKLNLLSYNLNHQSNIPYKYDIVLIDVRGSRDLTIQNAMVCTRELIVPTTLSSKGIQGVAGVYQQKHLCEQKLQRDNFNIEIDVTAVVPNFVTSHPDGLKEENRCREYFQNENIPLTPFEFNKLKIFDEAWGRSQNVFEFAENDDTELKDREIEVIQKFSRLADIFLDGGVPEDIEYTDTNELPGINSIDVQMKTESS